MSPSVLPSQTAVTPPILPQGATAAPISAPGIAGAGSVARTQAPKSAGPVTALPAQDPAERAQSVTGKAPAHIAADTASALGSEAVPQPKAQAALAAWLGPTGTSLAGKATEFNRYPTRYAHSSWVPENWGPWLERMGGKGRAEAALGESLMRSWKLDARPCFDFAPPARRLALLDAAPLERTLLLAGLARHADEVSRIMERGRVMDLKNQLGEDAYKFVRYRAGLLAGPLAAGGNAAATGSDWRARSMAAGMGMLGACLSGNSAANPEGRPVGASGVTARVALKLPREYAPYLSAGGGDGSVDGFMRLFRKVLAQEVDPAWDNLLS